MLKNTRSISLCVCDYDGNVLCNLYDNTSDLSGQATNVFVRRERNGWKELSFLLPSTCITDEGIERNYRLDSLITDYKIKTTEDKGTGEPVVDWFIISEDKVTHDNNSKNVEVIAGHISQLLNNKKLNLEFSDQDGNNVGTCEELLTTILEGTGWTVGNISKFFEDDGFTEKVRSLSAEVRTGALRLITELCDKFEARPVFNGDYTVDILPMNPFSEVEDGQIPEPVLNDDVDVIELHYNRNIHNLSRTLNTSNMVTRLYAYGSYGDMNGICGLSSSFHQEIIYKNSAEITNGQEVVFSDPDGIQHYFLPETCMENTQFTWSLLDFVSRSYIWDGSKAYELYLDPKQSSQIELQQVEIKSVQNYFDYIMNFDYYKKVGLFKDSHLQKVAKFQREMPAIIKAGMDAASELNEKEEELSVIAESNTGFLRLDVAYYDSGDNGELKLVLNKNTYKDGVMYRSDYDQARRNYFSWYVASALKEDGEPVTGIGSMVYIVHNTNPITYERAYLKEIDGEPNSYYYDDRNAPDPDNVTLWISRAKVPLLSSEDQFFLFCTNSISGQLGVRESEMESLTKTLQQNTKLVTEEHPTYFVWDDDASPSTQSVLKTYGWYYRSYSNQSTPGKLYFCYGERGETAWHYVSVSTTTPAVVNGEYFYNIKERKVYFGQGSKWVWEDDTETKRLGNNFTKVITACKKHDMLYKGVYERYAYTPSGAMSIGNYIFKNEYEYYWAFTTDQLIPSGRRIWMDTEQNLIYQNNTVETVVKPELKAFDALTYPVSNELDNTSFNPGIINKATGVEENSESFYRSNNIDVYGNVVYEYKAPNDSYIVFFDAKNRFIEERPISGTGSFTTKDRAKYARVIVSSISATSYLRVYDYTNYVFISDRQYQIIAPVGEGDKRGIHFLIAAMRDRSNEAYLTYLPIYQNATKNIKERDAELTSFLGDMYREGYWQKNEYVEGDEDKLYKDSKDALMKIAKPEATYDFTFLDLYKSNQGAGVSLSELEDVEWPDIDEEFAIHLIDEDIDVNCWAAVDTVNKCYDQSWLTRLEITTELSTIRRHSFTDALAYIADVANATKMNQTIYQRAANLTGAGKIAANKLEGALELAKNSIVGGSSNWYTDPKTGGIILVSADNNSAMMLTGAGWMLSTSKNAYGEFEWRIAASAAGLSADVITAGEMSAERLLAGSITTDKVSSSFGQELEIGSNKALMLYATTDGYRPAGGLKTQVATGDGRFVPVEEGDSYIEIAAKNGQNPAYVNIMTGGKLNLQGSEMNLAAKSEMHLLAGTRLDIRSDSDIEINANSKLNIVSGSDLTIASPKFNVYHDANGVYHVNINGTITATAGKIAGFNIGAIYKDNVPHDPEIDDYVKHRYIYSGTDSITSVAPGIYMGTNGLNVGGKLQYVVDGTKSYLKAQAEEILIGKQSSGSGTFIKMNAQTGVIDLEATSSINVKSDSTIAMTSGKKITITSSGSVVIGNGTRPFTVGGAGDRAYIYCGFSTIVPRRSDGTAIDFGTKVKGIYLGSDGINLGNVFKVTDEGTLQLKGTIYADAGSIGGWVINEKALYSNDKTVGLVSDPDKDIKIFAGNITASSAPFYVKSDGSLVSTKGTIGGWKITSNSLFADDESVGLTTNGDYRIFAGDKNSASSSFSVKKDGTLYAAKGKVGGWHIGSDYIGNQNSLPSSSVGLASGTGNSIVIWAGDTTASSANFYVTANGYLKSKSGQIGGWYIGSNYLSNAAKLEDSTVGLCTAITTENYVLWAGNKTIASAPFYVQANGTMKATLGSIGGWTITSTQLYSNDETVVLSSSGDYVFWASNKAGASAVFSVKKDGTLKSTKGTIGGWSIGTSQLTGNKTGMAVTTNDTDVAFWAGVTSGSSADSGNFYVRQNGTLYAGSATIKGTITSTDGYIGGWKIASGSLTGGTAGMGSSGTYAFWAGAANAGDSNFWVKHDGNLHASNADITGTIRVNNLYIGSNNENQIANDKIKLSATDISLNSNGKINLSAVDILLTSSGKIALSAVDIALTSAGKIALSALDTITIASTDVGGNTSAIQISTTGITAKTNGSINLNGGTFSVSSGNFSINSSGDVTLTGKITASSGKIGAVYSNGYWTGGWNINTNQLNSSSERESGYVALNSNSTWINGKYSPITKDYTGYWENPYAIWCGASGADAAPFRVSREGRVYATKFISLSEPDSQGQQSEKEINLSSYPLWKLSYSTIKDHSANSILLSNGDTINFKTADSFSLTGVWSNGEYVVDMTDLTGTTVYKTSKSGKITRDATDAEIKAEIEGSTHKCYFHIIDGGGEDWLMNINIDATGVYTNGYNTGYGKFEKIGNPGQLYTEKNGSYTPWQYPMDLYRLK